VIASTRTGRPREPGRRDLGIRTGGDTAHDIEQLLQSTPRDRHLDPGGVVDGAASASRSAPFWAVPGWSSTDERTEVGARRSGISKVI
jgi:hypothetical protein